MNRQRTIIFMMVLSLLSLLSLSISCSQVGAIVEVKTPTSTQSSADYEALSNRVSDLEKRVERLEQKSSQSNVSNIVITPSAPSPENNFETEFHNIQTAVMAMMADGNSGMLDKSWTGIKDLDLITANNGALVLSNYMTGLNADGTTKLGCKYDFAKDGTVTQRLPTIYIQSPQDYEKELYNVQMAVMAMMADSISGMIMVGTNVPQTNMHNVQSTGEKGMLYLSDYLTGLNGTSISSGCKYIIASDGTVTQIKP